MSDYILTFSAFGDPAPQGSKDPLGNGLMRESAHKTLKPFRDSVTMYSRLAIAKLPRDVRERFPLDGPLVASMVFTVKRHTNPARADAPSVRPDLDKYVRAAGDACTGFVYADDSQLVGFDQVWKTYPNRHPLALDKPGLQMSIRRATHAELGLDPGSLQGRKYTQLLTRWGAGDGLE